MSYLFLTLLFIVFGQLILKWCININGMKPEGFAPLTKFWLQLIVDLWVLSDLLLAFFIMMVKSAKFELSYACTFVSLSFVVVLYICVLLFNELIKTSKPLGFLIVIPRLIILSRGKK